MVLGRPAPGDPRAGDRLGDGDPPPLSRSPYQREFGRSSYGESTVEHLIGCASSARMSHSATRSGCRDRHGASAQTPARPYATTPVRIFGCESEYCRRLACSTRVSTSRSEWTARAQRRRGHAPGTTARREATPAAARAPLCRLPNLVRRLANGNGERRPSALSMDERSASSRRGTRQTSFSSTLDRFEKPYLDPRVNIIDALLYRARGMDVDTVLIDGEVVLREGSFVRLDENEILRTLVESAEAEPTALTARWHRSPAGAEAARRSLLRGLGDVRLTSRATRSTP